MCLRQKFARRSPLDRHLVAKLWHTPKDTPELVLKIARKDSSWWPRCSLNAKPLSNPLPCSFLSWAHLSFWILNQAPVRRFSQPLTSTLFSSIFETACECARDKECSADPPSNRLEGRSHFASHHARRLAPNEPHLLKYPRKEARAVSNRQSTFATPNQTKKPLKNAHFPSGTHRNRVQKYTP